MKVTNQIDWSLLLSQIPLKRRDIYKTFQLQNQTFINSEEYFIHPTTKLSLLTLYLNDAKANLLEVMK